MVERSKGNSVESYSSEALRHFGMAGYYAGTLDQMLANGAAKRSFDAWVARAESAAIAIADGFLVDAPTLTRATSEDAPTNLDKGVRSALDAYRARRLVSTWTEPPSSDLILEAYAVATKSVASRMDAIAEFRLQDDASDLRTALADAAEAADLREAARILGVQISDDSFGGHGRRMRLLIAPWLGGRVLGLKRASVPLALTLLQETKGAGGVDSDPPATLTRAMASALRQALDMLKNIRLLSEALVGECAVGRSTSSVGDAVEFFVASPIAAARDLEKALGLTRRGANFVIDELLKAGVVESAYPERTKNRVFLCRRALTL
jgi:hypothetical protein